MRRRQVVVQPRRGPGLLGTMARTAVVAGTAKATINVMDNAAASKQAKAEAQAQTQADIADMQAQLAAMQAQQAQEALPAEAPAAAAPADDLITKLKQLAELRDAGILSDDEFQAAKAKLLDT